MISEAEATTIFASALDARAIAYSPSETEAKALGREYVEPAAAPATAPSPAATPKPEPQTPEQMIEALTAPSEALDPISAAAFAPPADPSAYELPAIGADIQITPELQQHMADAQAALHMTGLPAGIGREIAARIDRGAQQPEPTPQAEEAARQSAMSQLTRSWGDKTSERVAAVQAEVRRVAAKHPQIIGYLERSGAGSDPFVVMQLWNTLQARKA